MRLTIIVLLALLAFAGCVSPDPKPTTTTPAGQNSTQAPSSTCQAVAPSGASSTPGAQVSNQPGSFSYNAQQAAASGKDEYKWTNPSTGARISWSGSAATGNVKLTLLDACGQQVFSNGVSGNGASSYDAQRGAPGAWLIRLEMSSFTGTESLSITSG